MLLFNNNRIKSKGLASKTHLRSLGLSVVVTAVQSKISSSGLNVHHACMCMYLRSFPFGKTVFEHQIGISAVLPMWDISNSHGRTSPSGTIN